MAALIAARVSETRLDSDDDNSILAGIGAHALQRYLPGQVLRDIGAFTLTGSHALILSNLPTQQASATPTSGFADEPEFALINALQFGLIRMLGCSPFAVQFENDGKLIRNVVPNPAAAGRTSSWGADSEFFWHSDNPHQPFGEPGSDPRLYAPQYLTFYSVRNEEQVPTELTAIEDVVLRLDEETRSQLMAPEFEVGAPDSNDRSATLPLKDVSVLDIDNYGRYRVRYDRGTTAAYTPTAAAALDRWYSALCTVPARELVLQPGDFMIFDNYHVLHRRRAFVPLADGKPRWLRRCYAA